MTTKFATIGWSTKKEANGSYSWKVTGFTYGNPTVTLHSGACFTRAAAMGQAKRVCRWHRQNSVG